MKLDKKGKLAWDYIVMILLALAVLVAALSLSKYVREKFIEGIRQILFNILGR